ncbi:hypothetical protein OE88DRAFT_344007 [Heliocybe sulcata]|uniref:Uncharacterized protein n=1 Tax=Heliocybe sulcata TaxID=5364 RepID=A0A5C3MYI6_9AGAM|nr:hypothetical protein OE88DRAFT_344007 [Heliocybe sulcata]
MSLPSFSAVDQACMRSASSCGSAGMLVPEDEAIADVDVVESRRGDKPVSATSRAPKREEVRSGAANSEHLDCAAASLVAVGFLRSINISLPTTYAEATNLADRFPQYKLAILSLSTHLPREPHPWVTSASSVNAIGSEVTDNSEARACCRHGSQSSLTLPGPAEVRVRVRVAADEIMLPVPGDTKVPARPGVLPERPCNAPYFFPPASRRPRCCYSQSVLTEHSPMQIQPMGPFFDGLLAASKECPSSRPGLLTRRRYQHGGPLSIVSRQNPAPDGFLLPPMMAPAAHPAGSLRPLTMTAMTEFDLTCDLPEIMRRMILDMDPAGAVPLSHVGPKRSPAETVGWHSREIVFGEGHSPRSRRGNGWFRVHKTAGPGNSNYRRTRSNSSLQGQDQTQSLVAGESQPGIADDDFDPGVVSTQAIESDHLASIQNALPRPRSTGYPPPHGTGQSPPSPSPLSQSSSPSASRKGVSHPPRTGRTTRSPPSLDSTLGNASISPSFSPTNLSSTNFHSSKDGSNREPRQRISTPIASDTHRFRGARTSKGLKHGAGKQLSLDELIHLMPHERLLRPVLCEYVRAQMEVGLPYSLIPQILA